MKKNYSFAISVFFTLFVAFSFAQKHNNLSSIKEINTLEPIGIKNSTNLLKTMFGLENKPVKFSKTKSIKDDLSYHIDTYIVTISGINIVSNPIKVISKNNEIIRIVGDFPKWDGKIIKAQLNKNQAFEKAIQEVKADLYLWEDEDMLALTDDYKKPEAELVYMYEDELKLVYKLRIDATKPLKSIELYIDATNGEIIKKLEKTCTIHVQGSGQSLYNGPLIFGANEQGYAGSGSFILHNTILGGGIRTYRRYGNTQSDVHAAVTPVFNDAPAVQAHWGAEQYYNYFSQKHNRNSYDGQGAELKLLTHDTNNNGNNATWYFPLKTALFGTGDGNLFNPVVSLDIVAHEFTHAIMSDLQILNYLDEPGALNESFADIFGIAVDYHATNTLNWELGEDILTNNTAFRSMSNPNLYTHPDTYLGDYWYSGNADWGGVHTNSGVQNFWFHLLTTGGNGTNDNGSTYTVNGIGIDKAAAIAYRNMTTYLAPTSQYIDSRNGAIQAAIDLYGDGSLEVIATTNAWYAVGIGSEYGSTANCINSNMTLRITVDGRPEEMGFLLQNQYGGYGVFNVAFGSLANQVPGTTVDIPINNNFTPGNYMFIAYDRTGDGLSSNGVNGNYELLDGSGNIILSKGNFFTSESHQICINTPNAFNYDLQPPTAPTNLTSSNLTNTSVDLNWLGSTDNTNVGGYYIMIESNNVLSMVAIYNSNLSYTLTNLTPGTEYKISVISGDIFSNLSPYSNTLTIIPGNTDTIPPSDPINLTGTNVTATSIDLDWDDSTDNVGVTEYDIYANGTLVATSTVSNYSLQNLTPNTNYYFKVKARDAAGNVSGFSNVLEAITPTIGCVTNLSLELNFDDHPEDVRWILHDSNYNPVIFGNGGLGYGNFQPYSSTTESINITNLPDGDYVFTFFDRSGNGFAGGGSYKLIGNGVILRYGTLFDFSETTEICIRSSNGGGLDLTTPTDPLNLTYTNLTSSNVDLSWDASTDNYQVFKYAIFRDGNLLFDVPGNTTSVIGFPVVSGQTYNLKVIARDPVGNFSNFSNQITFVPPSSDILHEGYFETGWDNWIDGGNDCNRYNESNNNNNRSYEGIRSIRLKDNSGVNSSMTLPNLNLSNYTAVELEFHAYIHSFEGVEDFWVLYNDGNSWLNIGTFVNGVDFSSGNYYKITVSLNAANFNLVNNAQFRIQCDASGNGDHIYIDQTKITATHQNRSSSVVIKPLSIPSFAPTSKMTNEEITLETISLYPNPSTNYFSIKSSNEIDIETIEVYNINGSLVKTINEQKDRYNIDDIRTGLYFIKVYYDNTVNTLRLIKK